MLHLALLLALAPQPVRVYQAPLPLPASLEAEPNPNPPFDLFATTRFNYPYTLRDQLTARRATIPFRALFLENSLLKCAVLPDVGGHLYSCTDKASGQELFYANPSLKKAQVGYRGAWAAFGIEFNFPVSHNWASMSPVDFATQTHADGSASIFVANTDRVYGMRWLVQLTLRPGSTVLEQHTTLSNPGPLRHRYYWWTNAAVEVFDDSRIIYPQHLSASHGFTFVDTWPVNQAGLDLSVVRNHVAGPVSQFSHLSNEPFRAVYHPKTQSGTVHYTTLPGRKIWAWGVDADGLDWRKALSDNNSAYVEVQAGPFRNQETYAFLNPQETLEFREYWLPVRRTGGVSRATLDAVLNLDRAPKPYLALNVTHELQGGQLRVFDGEMVILTRPVSLSPEGVLRVDLPEAKLYRVELRDAAGRLWLGHTENEYDAAGPLVEKPGPRPAPPLTTALALMADHELNGRLLAAWDVAQQGLAADPANQPLLTAAGRLAVHLMRYDEALALLGRAQAVVSNDAETHYALGLALAALNRPAEAARQFERALVFRALRPAAALQLAQLSGRGGRFAEALADLRRTPPETPQALWLETALLRALKRPAEARQTLARLRALDPALPLGRLEAVALGSADATLWAHLAADPERLLDAVTAYLDAGLLEDALQLLARQYPRIDANTAEPGALLPQDHPLISYYRAYVKQRLHQDPAADLALAGRQSTRYVFPSRPGTLPVLAAALAANPNDATAHFLLGSLHMAGGRTPEALAAWQRARALNARIPVLHRNLGLTLLHTGQPAAAVLREGLGADARNAELYSALAVALTLEERPAAELVEVLQRHPEPPAALLYARALALSEAARPAEALKLFENRFFPREEGGTNVRQVYLEIRAQAGASEQDLLRPVAGLEFTRDGLEPLVRDARVQWLLARHEADPKPRLQALLARAGASLALRVYQLRAARQLGDASVEARRAELRRLAEAGGPAYARALAWLELGKPSEARPLLRSVLLQPDRNLSHYLAREAWLAAAK